MSGRRVIVLYVALMLALAALGGVNQLAVLNQVALMDEKQAWIERVVDLRASAARIEGPHAVTAWAAAQGMVPAPENARIENVAPLPAPVPLDPAGGLEVRTVWQ